jgi:hypothetical protein
MNMEHWTECSEFDQDPRQEKHEKAGDSRIRRLIASQTSRFNFTLHDRTSDFHARKLRAIATADVQISA